ncbi:MAG: nucleotidyltransferase family protein [Bryobacterales bacterium]|nr:nucleotidyltransferase family protein [Bryobacterales bacterium]
MNTGVLVDRELLAEFCRANGIAKLSVFGSALRDDFRPDSDVDVLVEFFPGFALGLFAYAGMEMRLSPLFGGRKVDLKVEEELSRHFRQSVLDSAEVQYVEGQSPAAGHP